jgi:hypothetical protein
MIVYIAGVARSHLAGEDVYPPWVALSLAADRCGLAIAALTAVSYIAAVMLHLNMRRMRGRKQRHL